MHLRLATPMDLETIRHWDAQPHVAASGGDDDTYDWAYELPRTVSWREFLIAESNGRPIGVVVVIDPEREETHYWGDAAPNLRAIDIWIGDVFDLGKGYGTLMMRQAFERCFADPAVTAILIDPLQSNTKAIRFYKRLGFNFVENRRFGDDECCVMRFNRAEWEKQNSG